MPHVDMPTASTVIPFRPQAFGDRRERTVGDGERGRILLFTGIRYERLPEVSDDAAEPDGTLQVERDDDAFF